MVQQHTYALIQRQKKTWASEKSRSNTGGSTGTRPCCHLQLHPTTRSPGALLGKHCSYTLSLSCCTQLRDHQVPCSACTAARCFHLQLLIPLGKEQRLVMLRCLEGQSLLVLRCLKGVKGRILSRIRRVLGQGACPRQI